MNRTARIFTALLALLVVTSVVHSQDPAPTLNQDPVSTLNVDVDVVLIPTTVTNDRGQFIGGLDKDNFTIFEDRVQQDITYFSTEDAPMSLGIVLDASGSMNQITAAARRNGGGCMSAGTTEDEYFLIVFS